MWNSCYTQAFIKKEKKSPYYLLSISLKCCRYRQLHYAYRRCFMYQYGSYENKANLDLNANKGISIPSRDQLVLISYLSLIFIGFSMTS